jgi:hypothetical protein
MDRIIRTCCTFSLLILISLSVGVTTVNAAGHTIPSASDCKKIMGSGGVALKAVPLSVAESCKQVLALAPGAGANSRSANSPSDPCSGAAAAASVYCWGPWDVLQPAAAGPDIQPDALAQVCNRPECSDLFTPTLILSLPLESCTPGASCGFATIASGTTVPASAADVELVTFALAADGTSFTIRPGQPGEFQSAQGLSQSFAPLPGEFEYMQAAGIDGDKLSLLIARVIQQGGNFEYAADNWIDVDIVNAEANSGSFAWGYATNQADLDALNSGIGTVLNFSGGMSGDVATVANITLTMGPSASWTGTWVNSDSVKNFTAGGSVIGADFLSDDNSFSPNVQDGYVQGAILGDIGDQAVTHAVDVTLDTVGAIKDVGLLR